MNRPCFYTPVLLLDVTLLFVLLCDSYALVKEIWCLDANIPVNYRNKSIMQDSVVLEYLFISVVKCQIKCFFHQSRQLI